MNLPFLTSLKKTFAQLPGQIITWVQSLPNPLTSSNLSAFIKKRYKLLTALLFLLIVGPLTYLYSHSPQAAQAEWFNDHWQYRKRYPITYTGSETLTEYQVLVDGLDTATLISNGKLQSDCDDLRFTSSNGQLLSYSIVGNTCNTSDTKIWVQTRKIDADDSQIYMYYGNPSAPEVQNEKATFSYTEEKTVGYILHDSVNDLQVISLAEGNSISHNGTTLSLDQYETDSFSSTATNSAITAKKLFNADDSSGNTDLFVPISWAGTEFYTFSRDNDQNDYYYLLAPWQDATVTLYDAGTAISGCTDISITSTGSKLDCGITSASTIRIESDVPILVFASPDGSSTDPMPVHPATSQKWLGGGSTSRVVNGNASLDYRYIADDDTSEVDPADLAANSNVALSGTSGFGGGAVLIRSANSQYNYGANQIADGDGSDAHSYNDETEQGSIVGSANQADYVSVASTQEATCTIYEQNGTQLDSQTLTSSNTSVYHYGFGTGNSDTYTSDAWYMECDKPVIAHYQKAAGDDESNLMHYPMMRQYTYPTPSVGSPDAEETSPGPLASWQLDEGQGSTANDSTANQYNASLANSPTWHSAEQCVHGKCLEFDGSSNQYGRYSTNVTIPQQYTLSAWFRGDGNNQIGDNIYALGWDSKVGLTLQSSSGAARGGILIRNAADDSYHSVWDGTNILDNQWHHLAVTVNRNTLQVKVYIDGQLDKSDTITDHYSGSEPLIFGAWSTSYGEFTGFMDEPEIYPYARSAEEIKTDYQQGSVVLGAQDTRYLSEGLIGYWKLDDQSSPATDYSGRGYDLTWNSDVASASGKYNLGIDQPNGNNAHLSLSDTGDPFDLGTDNFSLSMWFNLDSLSTPEAPELIDKMVSADTGYHLRVAYNDEVEFQIKGTSGDVEVNSADSAITTDTWYHVVAVYDKENGHKIYINGQQSGSTVTGDAGNIDNSDPLRVGMGFNSWELDGTYDEVRIYNRALSSKEARDLYNWAPGPVAHYKMDEGKGTSSIYDSSGNQNTGTMNNMAEDNWISGKFGSALNFSGSNQRITLNSPVSSTGYTTVSVWYKRDENSAADNWRTLLGHATDNIHHLIIHSTSRNLGIFDGTFRDFGYTPPDDGQWHHFAVVYDNGNNATLYVDGKYQDQITTTLDLSSDPIGSIGNWNSGNYYAGPIDNIRIYKYARTQKQIIEDMNAGHPIGGSPISSKLLHLNFDEGYSTTTYDSGTNGDNGTLVDGPTWTNSGKFNKALSLDGTNDRVQDFTSDPFEYTGGDLTLSTWFKPNSSDSDTGRIISKPWNGGGEYNYNLTLNSNNTVRVRLYNGDTDTNQVIVTTNSTVNNDEWNHIAATLDGSTSTVKIYLNGQLDNSATHSITNWTPVNGDSDTSLTIGCYYPYGSGWEGNTSFCIQGEIDEVKIYNATLTENQIKHDMNQGASAVLGATSTDSSGNASFSSDRSYCPPGDTTSSCGPVAEWKFDEKSGTDAQDTSGNGNTGTLTNMESSDWKSAGQCKYGSCLDFDGLSSGDEHIAVSDSTGSSLDVTSAITVEAWVYPRSDGADHDYARIINKDAAYLMGIWSGDDFRSSVTIGSSEQANTCPDFGGDDPWNKWYHFAFTYQSGTLKQYVNGQLKCETSVTNGDIDTNDNTLYLGAADTSNYVLDGYLDQVRIYNYALSQSQIAWNYNRGQPVGHWKLDECQGTTAYDSSGNENHGDITIGGSGTNTSAGTCSGSSGEAWADGSTGKLNASLEFDGSDDNISISDNSILEPDYITISFWAKWNTIGDDWQIEKHTSTPSDYAHGYLVRTDTPTDEVICRIGNGSSGSNASASITTGTWYHVTCTHDGTNTKIYLNGQEKASDPHSGSIDYTGVGDLYLGSASDGTLGHTGQLDDIQIFNYALTSQQIKNLYNQSAIRFGPSSGSP